MQSKRRQQTTVALFFTVLLFLLVMAIVLPSRASSWLENRDLAKKPSFPTQIHDLKEYARAWDTYLADQVPFRDSWLRGYAFAQLRVLGKSEMNETVVGDDGYLLGLPVGPTRDRDALQEKILTTADQMAKLDGNVRAYGGRLLFVGVPDKGSFERSKYPSYVQYPTNKDVAESDFFAALGRRQVASLNLRTLFDANRDEQLYYRTDHHWTFAGAYLGYAALMERFSLPVLGPDELEYVVLPNPYIGSDNRLLGLAFSTDDRFAVGVVRSPVPYDLTVDGQRLPKASYYVLPNDSSTPILYGLYQYNTRGEVVADTHRPYLPSLLIVGDSFKGTLEPLLCTSFNQTRHLDLRHYTAMSVIDYVKKYQPDYVVYVLSGISYLASPWNVCDKPSKGSGGEE